MSRRRSLSSSDPCSPSAHVRRQPAGQGSVVRRRRRPMGPTCTYRRVQRRRRGGQPLQQRTRLVGLHALEVSIRRPDPPDAARGHPSTGRTERPSPLERRAADACRPNVRAQVGVAGEFGAEPLKKELHQRRQVRSGQTTWQQRGAHGPSDTVGASTAVTKIRAVPPQGRTRGRDGPNLSRRRPWSWSRAKYGPRSGRAWSADDASDSFRR